MSVCILTVLQQLQELRPQDSIPFLRRVSADMQRSEVIRYLADIDKQPSEPAPSERRMSLVQISKPVSSPAIPIINSGEVGFSPREHSFVKTTFGKRKLPPTTESAFRS